MVFLGVGGGLMWIPVIGWIGARFLFMVTLVLWIVTLLPGWARFRCAVCSKSFAAKTRDAVY